MSTTADELPDDADQATSCRVPIPLRERKRDWFFIIMFALFATTSFLIDTANMVGRPSPDSSDPMARMVYNQMVGIDPVLIATRASCKFPSGSYRRYFLGCFTWC